jgi:hypothetical protein
LCELPDTFELHCYGRGATEIKTSTLALLPHAFGPSHIEPSRG